MIALILSILLPGLGQFYYGKNIRAIFMLILTFTPLYPIVLVWSIIDVIILNKKEIHPKFSKKEAVWAIVILLVIIPVTLFMVFKGMISIGEWYSNKYIKPEITRAEGYAIVSAKKEYHKITGNYPIDIDTLIGHNPLCSRWKFDGWDEPYIFNILNNGLSFRVISKGQDQILGSEDDIIFQ